MQYDALHELYPFLDDFGVPTPRKALIDVEVNLKNYGRRKRYGYADCDEAFLATVLLGNICKDAVHEENFSDYANYVTRFFYETLLHEDLHLLEWLFDVCGWSSEAKIEATTEKLYSCLFHVDREVSVELKLHCGMYEFYAFLLEATQEAKMVVLQKPQLSLKGDV